MLRKQDGKLQEAVCMISETSIWCDIDVELFAFEAEYNLRD